MSQSFYVPALRWRQGEYQALLKLSDTAKDRLMPFLTLPPLEYDFEAQCPKKTVHEHVHPFVKRFQKKWQTRPAWIDVDKALLGTSMNDGKNVFSYVFDGLREFGANAVPVAHLDADAPLLAVLALIIATDRKGAAIRVRLEDLMKPKPAEHITAVMTSLKIAYEEVDLIIDLGAPNYEPYDAFASALIAALSRLTALHRYRNLVLIGTAIPESMKSVSKPGSQLPRHDWLFFKRLIAKLPVTMRRPTFGDYTIVHPNFTAIDMRKAKPSGKLVYTTEKDWIVRKGGAFQDNREQMHGHCADIVANPLFKGEGYSSGDDYIAKCATKVVGPSNQTRWKYVTINHHITHVLEDLAKLSGPP